MRANLVPAIFSLILGLHFAHSASAHAGEQKFQPDPLEFAPEPPIQCSWSQMKSEEFKTCLERKRFFEKMSAEEKKQFNAEVETRRKKVTVRIERGGGTIGTSGE